MSRITLQEFKKVLRKVLRDRNIDAKNANDIAERVMNLFGYDKTLTDNLLSSDDRDFFYILEDYDILTTEEETVFLPSGKRWRIHYWRIKEEKIREILENEEEEEEETGFYKKIYNDVWEKAEGR